MAKRSERTDPAIKVSATHEPAPSAGARSLFWVSAAFYALIAFEFFYMASPFAAYFYAVYGPGLDSLEAFGFTDRSLWFFLPHIVAETRSPLVDHARTAGAILFLAGLLAFFAGAFQVYRAKLRRSGDGERRTLRADPSPAVPGADRLERRPADAVATLSGPVQPR